MNVVALADEELEKFASSGRSENGRVVLLFEYASLVANDDAVAVDFLLHVRVVAGSVDAHQETAISQAVHFQILRRTVQR